MSKYKNYKDQKAEVAERIIKLRKERGYKTQMEWAIALYKPVWGSESKAKDKVRERDTHRVNYTVDELIRVCNLLNVDMDYLLGKQDEETHEIKDLKELTGLSEKACKKLINYSELDRLDKYIHNFNRENAMQFLSWFMENDLLDFISAISTLIDTWINARNKDRPVNSKSIPAPDSREITDYVSIRFDNEYKDLDFETKCQKADEEIEKIETEKDIFRLRTNDIAKELEDCIYRYCKIAIQEREGKQ